MRHFSHFSTISLDRSCLFTSQNLSLSLQTSNTEVFGIKILFLLWYDAFSLFFIMHFISFDLTFGVLENLWDFFFQITEVFAKFLGWVLFKWSILFVHYRCVQYMLNWCVLVGLDWANPMMSLILHVTCSCIFHAYVPSFLYFLILICVGAFLHVSFSHVLALVCSMAPKCKSIPT